MYFTFGSYQRSQKEFTHRKNNRRPGYFFAWLFTHRFDGEYRYICILFNGSSRDRFTLRSTSDTFCYFNLVRRSLGVILSTQLKQKVDMPSTPFLGGYRVTQLFGKRPEYYKQFGFAGHEGLDLVPLTPDKRIIIIEDGEVIRDVDPGERFDAYGYLTCVWNSQSKRCWWYAHNAFNLLELGDTVKRGQVLGMMGSSGNVDGAHLHLGLTISDSNKVRLNTDNGYKGFVDPLPVLEQLNKEEVSMPTNQVKTVSVDGELFEKIVTNSGKWDSTVKYVELPTDPAVTAFEDVQRVIAGFKSRVTDLQNQVNKGSGELENRIEQVSRLKDQLTNDLQVANTLLIKEKEARTKDEEKLTLVMEQATAKQNQIDELAKDKGTLNSELTIANQKLKEQKEKYDELLQNHSATITLADAVLILVKSFFGWAQNVQLKKTPDIDLSKLITQTQVSVEEL